MNGRMILGQSSSAGMINLTLRYMVRKIEQREEILVAISENPSVPDLHILFDRKYAVDPFMRFRHR